MTATVRSATSLIRVDMLHLRYFVAVAEEGTFARAAQRLHMAASPLSQRIKYLENSLGTALFVRSHHHVDLTAAGHALLPQARDLVERFDAIPRLIELATADLSPTLDVGVASDVTSELRTRVHDEFARSHPELVVTFHPGATEPLLQSLQAGRLDAALLHGPIVARGIETVRLHTAVVKVAVGRGNGFDGRSRVRLDELAHLAFVSIEHDAAPAIYRGIDELLRRHGVHKRIILPDHNFGGLAHVVAGGRAFSLVGSPTGAMAKTFVGEPIDVLDVEGTRLRLPTLAAWRYDTDGAIPTGALADVFRTLARRTGRNTEPPV